MDQGDRTGSAAHGLTMRPHGRFGSFFWTQFLGALNDNVFKNALVILVAYRSMTIAGLSAPQVVALCGGLLILPFMLFSPLAGQLADRYSKSLLIRWIKAAEIPIMALGAVGFATGSLALLLIVLFLMGTQSSFFGPVKYSILPQLLERGDLVAGNARVETGTFLAILLGTIIGGILVAQGASGPQLVSAVVVIVAAAGFAVSLRIPPLDGQSPGLRISINPLPPLRDTFSVTVANRTVLLSILGVSWFWFLGSAILSLLPAYVKSVHGADESVVTFFLALFCVGIAVGSQLCEKLSGHRVEIGLVPIGSLGMSLAAFDLFWAGAPIAPAPDTALLGARAFLAIAGSWRVVFDLALLAAFSGLFVVPLYALIQLRSDAAQRSRVIAGSNVLGAVFMVASSVMLVGLLGVGMSIPRIFGVLALLNTAVAAFIYWVVPEFTSRLVAWVAERGNGMHGRKSRL